MLCCRCAHCVYCMMSRHWIYGTNAHVLSTIVLWYARAMYFFTMPVLWMRCQDSAGLC